MEAKQYSFSKMWIEKVDKITRVDSFLHLFLLMKTNISFYILQKLKSAYY